MQGGVSCKIESFNAEKNHGDIVHPCVRFIPEGYEGHFWWMVYTPYYGADPGLENPILCYSESCDSTPPIEWKVYCEVKGKPKQGYNSDPTLFYSKGVLYVFWREYQTPSIIASGHQVGTFGGIVKNGQIINEFGPVVWSDDAEIDPEVSPTFLRHGDTYICLAMHLRFHSKWLKRQSPILKNVLSKAIMLFDLLGFGGQQISFGIARWESDDIDHAFRYVSTGRFKNCNVLYRPWHVDFFDFQGRLYAIVQTNQSNADICLAYSDDYQNFTFYNKPLITNASIDKIGLYKPCAGVTPDGVFYLFYTAQEYNNRKLNQLFLSRVSFEELLRNLQ